MLVSLAGSRSARSAGRLESRSLRAQRRLRSRMRRGSPDAPLHLGAGWVRLVGPCDVLGAVFRDYRVDLMRRPTSHEKAYAWHRAALAGEDPIIVGSEPQAGWYRRKLISVGPWVPARIWWHQVVDPDTGELLEPEELYCDVDEKYRDPFDQWGWLSNNPISESRFNEMIQRKHWAGSNDPTNPILNPERAVDLSARPTLPPKPVAGGLFDA